MVIKVHCPQGHSIICKDEQAGQTGKCPKCGEKIKVPGQAAASPPPEDNIVFLCPNGHKLNGPSSLQGRPGQCPHCQARFVIPDYSEPEEEAEATVVSKGSWTLADDSQSIESLEPMESLEEMLPDPAPSTRYPSQETEELEEFSTSSDLVIEPHPTAAMFRRLWLERQDGAIIELQLKDGSLVTPDRFAESSCDQDLGIFASRDSEGGYMLSAVAWDAVARVSVRRLQKLPRDMFS
ncbi:MAG: hypothetical protein K8T91_21930 [Planctomycetes bacterium]|nr:hypothetical protein [Planctomycetota bacterium]